MDFLKRLRELKNIRRAIKLVWETARLWTIASLALMIVKALLPLLLLYLIKLTVDAITAGITAVDKIDAWQEVMLLVILTALTTLVLTLCEHISDIIQEHQGQLVTDHISDIIHRKSAELDLAFYEDSHYQNTFYRAQVEAPSRPTQIVKTFTQLTQNTISILALVGLLFYLHWGIALVLIIAALPSVIIKIRHSERMYEWRKRRTETERWTYEYHTMLTNIYYAKELRIFDLSGLFRKRYIELRKLLRGERLDLSKKRAKADMLAQTVTVTSLFAMVVYIAWQTIQGIMTLGDMVMYQQAFKRAQNALQGIMSGLAALYEHNLFLNNFYGFMELKPVIVSPENPVSPPRPMQKGIELNNINFSYPGTGKKVLKDINLKISPGEVVALVGDNGAGKSTIAKLLCRLYEPTEGRITIDNIDYKAIDIKDLRRETTMIFQDYIQYPMTVRENIWLGDITTEPESRLITSAARKAGAEELISRLSDGYDTLLGRRFDKGEEISIGEWQKIALSRAFLRDAQLIILDEPTSAMSVRSEYELFQSFKKLLEGRSALLISHRFSTVRMADLICVLENGSIVEQGSHEELMGQRGRYATLYEMQAGSYL